MEKDKVQCLDLNLIFLKDSVPGAEVEDVFWRNVMLSIDSLSSNSLLENI